ncbi:MAG: hypothetical protein Q4G46_16740 [Propionibacteriaceae bacterium]|nr:hypothetical protein [Propionibacteriaceae bacterium]
MSGTTIVAPTATETIVQQPGRDLLTLLSCHPFPINTERILVFTDRAQISDAEIAAINPALLPGSGAGDGLPGYRTEPGPAKWLEQPAGRWFLANYPAALAGLALIAALGVWMVVIRTRRRARADDD